MSWKSINQIVQYILYLHLSLCKLCESTQIQFSNIWIQLLEDLVTIWCNGHLHICTDMRICKCYTCPCVNFAISTQIDFLECDKQCDRYWCPPPPEFVQPNSISSHFALHWWTHFQSLADEGGIHLQGIAITTQKKVNSPRHSYANVAEVYLMSVPLGGILNWGNIFQKVGAVHRRAWIFLELGQVQHMECNTNCF